MTYGVTRDGFVRPRLVDIKKDFESRLATKLGQPISIAENSVLGIQTGIIAERISNLWEVGEAIYNSMYPMSAEGTSLDGSIAFTAQKRIPANKTIVPIDCFGLNGTVLPTGTTVTAIDISQDFELLLNATITQNSCVNAKIGVVSVVEGQAYDLVVAGTTYTHTAINGDTPTSILIALSSGITGASIANEVLTIAQTTPFAVTVSTNLAVQEIATRINFTAVEFGELNPGLNKVTKIKTLVNGFNSCTNTQENILGRSVETDTQLRQRYNRGVAITGQGYLESIEANIAELENVTAVIAFENDTNATNLDGLPPHSIEVIVQGGENEGIAQTIFKYKPAGITTFGDVSVSVKDVAGVDHNIKFNRPTPVKIWLQVTISKNSEEEYAADTPQRVREIILAQGELQKVGEDVILQKFIGNIFRGVNAIGTIEIKGASGETTPISYTADNIVLGVRELATFDTTRIVVNVL